MKYSFIGLVCLCLSGVYSCQPAGKKAGSKENDGKIVLSILKSFESENAQIYITKVNSRISELEIENARISEFPVQLGQMDSLRKLLLSNDSIRSIKGLDSLTSLTDLDLSDNQIKILPTIRHLKSLKFLRLDNNQIQDTLDCLLLPESLEALIIGNNQISAITNISRLINLKTLSIDSNKLREFPEGLCELKRIWSIEANGNDFQEEINDFSCFEKLGSIVIDSKYLGQLVLPEGTVINYGFEDDY
ncbi:MAG: leucine-rich repeat domain-containing protein [Bacteroidia bacterium]